MIMEMQADLMRSWFKLAETGVKVMTDLSVGMGRASADAWSRTLSTSQPSLPFPMQYSFPFAGFNAFPGFAAASQPMLPLMQMMPMLPFAGAGFGGIPFAGFGMGPFAAFGGLANPWLPTSWPRIDKVFDVPRQPSLFDAMASSYRTASGHASAAIIQPFLAPSQPWWAKPYGRGWLN